MAWNRPVKGTSDDRAGCATATKRRFRLVASSAVIVLAVTLSALLLTRLPRNDVRAEDEKGWLASSLKDADQGKSVHRSFVAKTKSIKTSKVQKPVIGDADVFFAPKTLGRIVIWKIVNPPVFTNQFEGFVADVLTAVPGERFLDSELDDDFDEAFRESLKHAIVINDDDSEEGAARKHAVMKAKEEVKRRVAEGERPRDIVLAARDELNKIADYRDNIQAAFNKYLLTENDPKEILRYEQEANALLDEYGACHIDGPHDEETAYEMIVSAKEEKIQELTESLSDSEKENTK